MNFKTSTFAKCFCCLILLASSLNSLENVPNNDSGEKEDEPHRQMPKNERASSIEDQLNRISMELRQTKERENLLKIKIEKIDEALNELKSTVDDIKLQMNESDAAHDRRFNQLSNAINDLKKRNAKLHIEATGINEILRKNETLEKSEIPFIDFQKCNKSLNIERDKPAFTLVVNDLRAKMALERFEMQSEIFPLKGYSMKAQAKLWFTQINLWCTLSFKDTNKSSEDVIDLKLLPSVNYVFKNQSQLGHYNDIIFRHAYPHFNKTFKYDTNYYEHILIRSRYDMGDTAVIDIYVETPEQAEQSCSEDGSIAWAVHDVRESRKREQTENVIFHASPYFYSSPKGYRMVAAIGLNGYDDRRERNGLWASTPPISGLHDDGLNKSFNINATFSFLHPTDPTKNIVKMAVKTTKEMLETIYLSNEEVDSLLVNDTLYYHVTTQFL